MVAAIAAVVAAIAAVVAAIAAVLGLRFIGLQIKEARKSSDLLILQALLKDSKEHENALLAANSDDEKNQAFIELLNFLEIYAEAINNGLVPEVSCNFVSQKLRDSLVFIQNAPIFHDKLKNAITSPETFEALRKFMEDNKSEISALLEAHRRLKVNK